MSERLANYDSKNTVKTIITKTKKVLDEICKEYFKEDGKNIAGPNGVLEQNKYNDEIKPFWNHLVKDAMEFFGLSTDKKDNKFSFHGNDGDKSYGWFPNVLKNGDFSVSVHLNSKISNKIQVVLDTYEGNPNIDKIREKLEKLAHEEALQKYFFFYNMPKKYSELKSEATDENRPVENRPVRWEYDDNKDKELINPRIQISLYKEDKKPRDDYYGLVREIAYAFAMN